jgi:hypothetical protein
MTQAEIKTTILALSSKLSTTDEQVSTPEEQQSQANINNILEEYSTSVEPKFFTWICKSIIEGDYIGQLDYKSNLNEVKKELETFRSRLLEQNTPINDSNLDSFAQNVETIDLNEIIRPVLLCIDRINVLIDQIKKRDKLELHKPLFIVNDESNKWVSEFSEAYRYASDINSLLIGIEYYDNFLTVDHNTLKNLAYIHTQINDQCLINDEIKELMRIKCYILIKKILLRLDEDKVFSYRYVHNYQDKQLIEFTNPLTNFTEIDDLIANHYKDDIDGNSKSNIDVKARPILQKKKNGKALKYSDYQILSKYYKDKAKSEKELIELRELFDRNSNSSYISNICDQYLLNNCLSLYKDKQDDHEIRNTYIHIKVLESANGIKNYFPHLYFCKYLRDTLNRIIETKNDINQFDKLLVEFNDVKKEAYKTYEWCKDSDFMSYRVPFDECLFIDGEGEQQKKLHIASSYILPNNYEQIKFELDELSNDYQKFITLKETIKETVKLTNEVNEAKKAFENAEKKNIEILSIFSAIVLFVASEIQLFRFITEAHQAIMYTLILAFCISVFVLLIWVITRDNNINSANWFIIIVLGFGSFFSLYYAYTNPFPEQPKIKEYDEAINQIERLEQRIAQDSIDILILKKTK